jgi:Uma2 family endonuclease
MPAIAALPEQRVLLENISWETYDRLLSESVNKPGTRFAYDNGSLEIMVVSWGHEVPNRTLAQLVAIVAEETGRDWENAGSTTLRRKDLAKGIEPDSSFYFAHAARVRGQDDLDMATDPPPELTIEVDITRSSLDRFPIFAGIGISEVWRYDGERVFIFRLAQGKYVPVEASSVLPPLTAAGLTELLEHSRREKRPDWLRRVREWVRSR